MLSQISIFPARVTFCKAHHFWYQFVTQLKTNECPLKINGWKSYSSYLKDIPHSQLAQKNGLRMGQGARARHRNGGISHGGLMFRGKQPSFLLGYGAGVGWYGWWFFCHLSRNHVSRGFKHSLPSPNNSPRCSKKQICSIKSISS